MQLLSEYQLFLQVPSHCSSFLSWSSFLTHRCKKPEWVFQSYILVSYPVPYALFQTLTSTVLVFCSPMVTSKMVVVIYGLPVLLAIQRLIWKAKLDPLVGWVFLVSVAALNSPFWNGYMGYQFGLIALLFYLSLSIEARTEVLPGSCFSLLAFFAHGVIYASLLVYIWIYSVYGRQVL